MSDMKKLLQIVNGTEEPKQLNESVSFNLSMSGDNPTDVADMFNKIMGLSTSPASTPALPAPMPPMSTTLGKIDTIAKKPIMGDEVGEDWENEPNEEYKDVDFMTKDAGIQRKQKPGANTRQGDNPMAYESIAANLMSEYQKFKSNQ
jgi:hypothetical protein